jgi:FemAB-related protein (PEP-CTERM system-associated)
MSLSVESFDGAPEEWDAFLADLEGGTFCHRYGWRGVMEDALGHDTYWMVARGSSGAVEALLPLVRVRSRLFGDYLVSMPFLNYGGPVGTVDGRRALAAWARSEAQRLGVDLLELRNRASLAGTDLDDCSRKITVLKPLPDSRDELWERGIKAKVRSQIRRPMKEGMDVEFGAHLLDDFYGVFSATMRDLGTPVLPRSFFVRTRSAFPDSVVIAVVRREGEPVAAGLGLSWDGEFEITWAGASRKHSRLAPNMLLYWSLMEQCLRTGISVFNFGRCSPDSGTHRFKRQWGSEDQPLPWLQWSPAGVPSTPTPDSPKYRAATSIWSRLPVPVTNLVGPRFSRILP